MSYRINFAEVKRLYLSPAPVTFASAPFTLSGWFKLDNFNTGGLIGLSDSTVEFDYIEVGPNPTSVSTNNTGTIIARTARGSSSATTSFTAGPSPARFAWTPFVLTVTADNRFGASVSGSALAYANLPAGSSAWNTLYSGTRAAVGSVAPWNGLIAAMAVHNGSWDQTLVNLHATGRNPGTMGACLAYWPLTSDLSPVVGGAALISTAATPEPADNPILTEPPILRPVVISLF